VQANSAHHAATSTFREITAYAATAASPPPTAINHMDLLEKLCLLHNYCQCQALEHLAT